MKEKILNIRAIIFMLSILISASSFISPPIALLLGIIIALSIGNPYLPITYKLTHKLLQISVVGLGFGMNVSTALKAGSQGFLFTVFTIVGTILIGFLIGKLLKIEEKISYLISVGTAICGGSAIAAVSPIVKAEEKHISVALGTVFVLNSVALFTFPIIGEILHLSESQFGMWCAIAIHDTSSVVGAASKYGMRSLEVATTVKLARALWIIPLAFFSTLIFKKEEGTKNKIKIPYFIGWFIIAMIANSYIPAIQHYSHYVTQIAKIGLTVTLFLIGSSVNKHTLSAVGFKPFILGVSLWIIIASISLWLIYAAIM